ncbi:hypothetical protein LSAT2_014844 [Lamellibrachia satsuma]|nr:hypothetical protein LSAT2_014844 [Lamellibrachia satsuma]
MLVQVILLLQKAGLRGRCGHNALSRVVLEHRRDPASVTGWLAVALLVTVFLPSNGCATPMIVQAAGLRGRCGHSALSRVVLDHRRDPASVPGWLAVALLVTVFLPSNGCAT